MAKAESTTRLKISITKLFLKTSPPDF